MTDHVYRLSEIVGSSGTSVDEAIRTAIRADTPCGATTTAQTSHGVGSQAAWAVRSGQAVSSR